MAVSKSYVRLWPLAFAAVGVAGFGVFAWKAMHTEPQRADVEEQEQQAPSVDPGPDQHYETVRRHFVDEYTTYRGEVSAESPIVLRAPKGMRVPIVKFHHEQGDFLKKGDVIVSFDKQQVDDAIARAHAAGKTDDEARFRSYLDYVDFKAPCDGVLLSLERTSYGDVPLDDGIGICTIADKSSYRFVVQIPGEVQRTQMAIGTKFTVELDEDKGSVAGVVSKFMPAVSTDVPVVLALEPHEGIEARLAGTIRVPTGRREAGLLPKSAVEKRGEAAIVRAYDPDSRSYGEKSVTLGGEIGPDYVVLSGVFAGDSVVVPGKKPRN